MTRYKKLYDQKELQIKMPSLLNVSKANSESEEFSLKDIEVYVDSEEKIWFKRVHVRKFLGIADIRTSLKDLKKGENLIRQKFITTWRGTPGWPGPKNQQNKTDKFLSVFGIMYDIVNSNKDKGKALKAHILIDILPRGLDAKIERIQEKHQQAIEENDATIPLLNDS